MAYQSIIRYSIALCAVIVAAVMIGKRDRVTQPDPLCHESCVAATHSESPADLATPTILPTVDGFTGWAAEYVATSSLEQKQVMLESGVSFAKERRAMIKELIRTDPRRALELAIPLTLRRSLPEKVQSELEKPISARGDFSVVCVTPVPGTQGGGIVHSVTIEDKTYDAFVYGERADHPTRENIPLQGIAIDDVLAVAEDPVRELDANEKAGLTAPASAACPVHDPNGHSGVAASPVDVGGELQFLCGGHSSAELSAQLLAEASEPGGTGGSSYTEGHKRLVFFRVAFSNISNPALGVGTGENLIRQMNDFWRDNSYGKTTVAAPGEGSDVITVTLDAESSSYDGDWTRLRSDVHAKAAENGVNVGSYHFDVVCVGSSPSYSFGGIAWVGAKGSVLANNSFGLGITAHELGHNLGLLHARYHDTGGESVMGPGDNQEYGDGYDVMGSGRSMHSHYAAKYKWRMDWIPGSDYPRVSGNGLFRVYSHDYPDATNGVRGLRIRHSGGDDLSFTYRARHGGHLGNGIGMRRGGPSSSNSQLLDTTPGTSGGKGDSPILIGRTFKIPDTDVRVTPVRHGNTYPPSIDVQVYYGTPAGNEAPSLFLNASKTNVAVGESVVFTIVAEDANGDEIVYSWDYGDGGYGLNTDSVTRSWGDAGHYVVQCTATDMKGGETTRSVAITVGSPSSFSISGRVFHNGQPMEGVMVRASGSQYAFSASDGTYTITGLGGGGYSVSAQAYPFTFVHPWFNNPVNVGPNAANIDFLTTESLTTSTLFISEGSTWKYLDDGSDQGAAWRDSGFDDSSWAEGPAQLGYGDGDEATVVSFGGDANNKHITTYFRRTINVGTLPDTDLTLTLLWDDGAVVYINGTEVVRENMPAGAITSTTTAEGAAENTTVTTIDRSVLVAGTNTIAVEIHQANSTSSDISFDLKLEATEVLTEYLDEGSTWTYLDDGSDQGTAWKEVGFDDSSWASGRAELGYGDDDETTVVSFGGDEDNKFITTYFRRVINVNQLPASDLTLRLTRDDGAVVYINGQEVHRDNMPGGTITHTTLASGGSETTTQTTLDPSVLALGENTLAVEVHQVSVTSSDISFDFALQESANPGIYYVTRPVPGEVVITPGVLAMQLTTQGSTDDIVEVVFYVDGAEVGRRSSAPYSLGIPSPPAGDYIVTIDVINPNGAAITAGVIPVTVAPRSQTPQVVRVVSPGSTWAYLDDGSDQGTAWREPGFDDSSWATGAAQLGYGDGDETTVVGFGGDANNKHITTYFRGTMNIDDANLVDSLTLQLVRDDGAVIYINGVEAYRDNMPAGAVDFQTVAAASAPNEAAFHEVTIDPIGVVSGLNVIAVEMHQRSGDSSDMSFDLEVLANVLPNALPFAELTAPTEDQLLLAPTDLQIRARAGGGEGEVIERVEFYDGVTKIGESLIEPYSFDWIDVPEGEHVISVRAVADSGMIYESSSVTVTVFTPPVATQLIPMGSRWNFLDDGSVPSSSWNDLSYNDAAWRSGSARLGYGGDGEVTTLNFGTDPGKKFISTYFRHYFTVESPGQWDALALRLVRDDAAVVYLNGTEVFRNNLLSGVISHNSLAVASTGGAAETTPVEALIDSGLLVNGDNVIAVEVHQSSITSSDLGFDLELVGHSETNISNGIYLASPAAGAEVFQPHSVSLSAYALSPDGITLVEYFVDGTNKIGESTNLPFNDTWNSPDQGNYVITAVATLGTGGTITSPPVQITVHPPPIPVSFIFEQFVNYGSEWRYLDTGVDPGPGWQQTDYDHASWPTGDARLGFGDDGEVTLLTAGITTAYFRQWFNVPNPAYLTSIDLELIRDDGAVVYINGKEVFRNNMPIGFVDYDTLAAVTTGGADETTPVVTSLDPVGLPLVAGQNLIAVEVHQASLTSSDLAMDMSLTGTGTTERRVFLSRPSPNDILPSSGDILLEAQVSSGEGVNVVLVEFFIDGQKLGELTSGPFEIIWPDPEIGTYIVDIVVTDDRGTTFSSVPVELGVGFVNRTMDLIPSGAVWNFLDDGSDPGATWAALGFDDSDWGSGGAQLGYGDGDEVTEVSFGADSANKHPTTYFRREFTIPSALTLETLRFRLLSDDGAIVWFNGVEVHRENMPVGPVNYLSYAAGTVADENAYVTFELPVVTPISSPAVVAVEVHQASASSSDISFDLQLLGDGIEGETPPPSMTITKLPGRTVELAWPASAPDWVPYNALSLNGPWLRLNGAIVVTNGMRTMKTPSFLPQRFYQLRRN